MAFAVPRLDVVRRLSVQRAVSVTVVFPMVIAVGARASHPERVSRYDTYYPAMSAVMVILIIGGVTAANAETIRTNLSLLAGVGAGVVTLNGLGYAIGFLVGSQGPRPTRIASILSVGMRDFAVAAALVIAVGLPTLASLPAVVFGVVEMATSAGLAKWFSRRG